MKTLGVTYDNVLKISKQNNYTISNALNLLQLNGYATIDIDYDLILKDIGVLSAVYKNGFAISSVLLKSNLTSQLNVIKEINAIDFCLHYNLNNIVIMLDDFSVDELSLSILKKNLRRIVKYASNFNVKISIKNSYNTNNIYSQEMLLDLVKSVKGLLISLDVLAFYKANNKPLTCEDAYINYLNKVYLNDQIINGNTIKYCPLFNGMTGVLENLKNFKKLDNSVDFAIFSILDNCEYEEILINSALNFLMEINYGQD